LQRDGAPHSLGGALELDQQIIVDRPYDPTGMLGDFGVNELIAMGLQLFEGALLVCSDQLRLAHHFSS
jgi:hypothetical protein